MKYTDITTKTVEHDLSRLEAMTDADVHAVAMQDPDAQPTSDDDYARARRVPWVKTIRRALGLTHEDFAARFHIPVGTLRDREQGKTEPDQTARAFLRTIARDPDGVERALALPSCCASQI